MTTTTKVYTQRAQARTAATALRGGTHWTQAELDRLRDRAGTLEQAAVALQRTLYSVTSAQRIAVERREREATQPTRRVLPFDRGYTTLAEMGW